MSLRFPSLVDLRSDAAQKIEFLLDIGSIWINRLDDLAIGIEDLFGHALVGANNVLGIGALDELAIDDLLAAQTMANHENYPRGFYHGTPSDAFESRRQVYLLERRILVDTVVKYVHNSTEGNCPCEHVSADIKSIAIHRRAARHVLVDLGYLVITRRPIPQQFPPKKCATIT